MNDGQRRKRSWQNKETSVRPPRQHSTIGIEAVVSSVKAWKAALLQCGRKLSALLAIRLGSKPISARDHGVLLSAQRREVLAARLRVAAILLGLATIAWIPIDGHLLSWDWRMLWLLTVGRITAGAMFFAIGWRLQAAAGLRQVAWSLGAVVYIGVAFFVYAHVVFAMADKLLLANASHTQYVLLPIALAAAISIFPLTVMEAGVLLIGPLASMLLEIVLNDGGEGLSEAGIAALLMCVVVVTAMISSVSQLKLLLALEEHSTMDLLTGALSRRAGTELLNLLFAKAERAGSPFSISLIDLDHFKRVNDGHGHDAGDCLLRGVAKTLKARLRREDALIRWGGEEFLLVLAGMPADATAELVAELCGSGLAARPDGSMQTASVGLAERQCDRAGSWEELVELADARMYEAKRSGRNQLTTLAGQCIPLARGARTYVAPTAQVVGADPRAA